MAVDGDALLDHDTVAGAEFVEVADGAEMDVLRLVPRIVERRGHRHAAGHRQLQPYPPVGEIRKRDDGAADDAQHRSEEHTSELQSLKSLSYAVVCLNKKR